MKRLLTLVLVCLMCLSSAFAQELTLDEQVAKIMRNHSTTGAALVVARNGKIVYEYYYGYAEKRAKEMVEADTYFRLASVTKLISGIHVMQLVERSKLDLDQSIGDYLGYPVENLRARETPVTLRHLMSHTSALNSRGGYASVSRTLPELLDATLNRKTNWLDRSSGSKYEYSNFGAGIMGALVEAVTGRNVNDSITKDLFAPLGIDGAYHPTLLDVPEKIAAQYMPNGTVCKSRSKFLEEQWDASVDPDRHYRITVGSLWMKPRDLCRLGIMMVQGGQVDGVRILKSSTVDMMMKDQLGEPNMTVSSPYGLCVNRVEGLLDDRLVYGHQGLSEGTLCNLYWEPQTEFVFALVTNGSSVNMDHHIGKLARRTFALMWEQFGE